MGKTQLSIATETKYITLNYICHNSKTTYLFYTLQISPEKKIE